MTTTTIIRPLTFRHKVTAFLGYLALTLGMTYPWILRFTTYTPDGGGEGSVFLWNLWAFRNGLLQGNPFTTNLLVPPYTLNLVFHTYTLSRDLLALPLLPIFGLVLTTNLLMLLSFSLSGVGAWQLIHDLTGDKWASFVGGLVYVFAPWRFAHLVGHYNLASIEWLPFYALFTLRYFRDGHRRDLALSALAALAASLTEYTYALYLILWTVLLVLWRMLGTRAYGETVKRTVTLAISTLIIHMPLLGLMAWAIRQGAWVGVAGGSAGLVALENFSADLVAFVTPSAQHPLFGAWLEPIRHNFTASFSESTVYLGLVPLALALFSTLRFRQWAAGARLWVLTFWSFVVLALGPRPHWLGQLLLGPLPYFLLDALPGFREARIPSRMTVMVMLSLACLVGLVLAHISQSRLRPWRFGVYTLIALTILFEYLPAPLIMADRSIPRVYEVIAADTGNGAVLNLPFGINSGFRGLGGWNPQALYFQTATGHPIVGAHIARIPDRIFDAYAQMPVIGRLAQIERGATFTPADVMADRLTAQQMIETVNLRYIVVPDWQKTAPDHIYLQQVFAGCLDRLPDDGITIGYRVRVDCFDQK